MKKHNAMLGICHNSNPDFYIKQQSEALIKAIQSGTFKDVVTICKTLEKARILAAVICANNLEVAKLLANFKYTSILKIFIVNGIENTYQYHLKIAMRQGMGEKIQDTWIQRVAAYLTVAIVTMEVLQSQTSRDEMVQDLNHSIIRIATKCNLSCLLTELLIRISPETKNEISQALLETTAISNAPYQTALLTSNKICLLMAAGVETKDSKLLKSIKNKDDIADIARNLNDAFAYLQNTLPEPIINLMLSYISIAIKKPYNRSTAPVLHFSLGDLPSKCLNGFNLIINHPLPHSYLEPSKPTRANTNLLVRETNLEQCCMIL